MMEVCHALHNVMSKERYLPGVAKTLRRGHRTDEHAQQPITRRATNRNDAPRLLPSWRLCHRMRHNCNAQLANLTKQALSWKIDYLNRADAD